MAVNTMAYMHVVNCSLTAANTFHYSPGNRLCLGVKSSGSHTQLEVFQFPSEVESRFDQQHQVIAAKQEALQGYGIVHLHIFSDSLNCKMKLRN